jgi:predicted oxidoreductase
LSSQFGVSRMNDKQVELLSKTLLAVERDMDMNQIPLSLSVLERHSGDLMYAHLNNGRRALDAADLRLYIQLMEGKTWRAQVTT